MSEARTHDYSGGTRGWGHDYIFTPKDGGHVADASGWGRGISDGDFLLLDNEGDSSRYYVETIRYEFNPGDMWHAKLIFAPRPTYCSECREVHWKQWRDESRMVTRREWSCGHFVEQR